VEEDLDLKDRAEEDIQEEGAEKPRIWM